MRLEVILKPERNNFLIPINYNYPLSAAIYKVFATAGPNFAEWLHKKGFSNDGGKRFKFFNFSRLYFNEQSIQNDLILAAGNVRFYISSPIEETLILNFINGLLSMNSIFIGNSVAGTNFKVMKASIMPPPKFDFDMNFIMLSPTVASVKDSKGYIKYLNTSDSNVTEVLANNLKNKYKILNNKIYNEFLHIALDENYISSKGGAEKVTKLISIKENTSSVAKIRCFFAPLRIIGDTEIIKLAYYSGIGEKNSLGLGMIEVK